jgi:CHASE1-domain containing sensor protein
MQFVRSVPEQRLQEFSSSIRKNGYPAFNVHPASSQQLHYIIEYTEPLKGNEAPSAWTWRRCRRT